MVVVAIKNQYTVKNFNKFTGIYIYWQNISYVNKYKLTKYYF